MHIARAAIIYFMLMFSTIFIWFVLGQHIVDIMVMMNGAVDILQVNQVTQNCIYATNFIFIFFLILWTIWFAYVAHSREEEQTYQYKRYY